MHYFSFEQSVVPYQGVIHKACDTSGGERVPAKYHATKKLSR